ncbi:MAG: 3-methyl-2-oxobutanoate hydroxymethyltransferase [Gammaproteobacteria bacterium]|uniref:3-methyl-2-oxobutanoate hydroxymethyltransferase n=1 Tax=Limnobacter sp. TaxID=2003368 RepID=UPI001DE97E8E|nr:3-methyl-2-oxobutanoate hydroxymethyltransferase [Limnobacter sp.]MBU0784003.1 3-methyl-2-oxobutanoate hydroxymethyltransferase [Gammaproteobacteria bacterium]MBU0848899.1 3-methyl-2-oxobutanoate hydroxymethyltransferase [Gammaproteobacteria bacterium]MBU1267233.1 3-methyl-2-oxobutanoate hydroxymethyltransferase [Gammaproteobacteria bacterium]MBU1527845.1 3-methyl-2-oxobutanoate hydroxymethyltransferase [Gammaproteobacteria bacterium]MBU1778888.1 3-methyl-2-oxobutanoate hydroxymethyltransfe
MSAQPHAAVISKRKAVTLPALLEMKKNQEKIAMLTCYDACFASVLDASGVDILLIGDSLGMVLAGMPSTLPVTMDMMQYHTRCVAAGNTNAFVVADMPFGSYQESVEQAYRNAARLMAAGANMVKLEGTAWLAPTIEYLTTRDIPVCAHLGLTPQSVSALGGYRVQGRDAKAAKVLKTNAKAMQEAGAQLVLFELIPGKLAADISKSLTVPSIGIGAGVDCDGQVLVLHDMLNVFPGKKPKFVRNFMDNQPSIQAAVQAYVSAVKDKSFPTAEHTF